MKIQMATKIINVARDFARYPAGRYISDGPYSGEEFRKRLLLPAYTGSTDRVVIEFDGARGYGSSFLEEAFGGLVRAGVNGNEIIARTDFRATDKSLVEEIHTYIKDQSALSDPTQ